MCTYNTMLSVSRTFLWVEFNGRCRSVPTVLQPPRGKSRVQTRSPSGEIVSSFQRRDEFIKFRVFRELYGVPPCGHGDSTHWCLKLQSAPPPPESQFFLSLLNIGTTTIKSKQNNKVMQLLHNGHMDLKNILCWMGEKFRVGARLLINSECLLFHWRILLIVSKKLTKSSFLFWSSSFLFLAAIKSTCASWEREREGRGRGRGRGREGESVCVWVGEEDAGVYLSHQCSKYVATIRSHK